MTVAPSALCEQKEPYVYFCGFLRFHRTLDDLLSPPSRLKVLRQLARFPAKSFTGRELAEASGLTPTATNHALEALLSVGVVATRRAGRAHVWQFAATHAWAPRLSALFEAEANARDEMRHILALVLARLPIKRARVFGSVARREERPESDIDLCLDVSSEAQRQEVLPRLGEIQVRAARNFGNPLAILIRTEAEVRRLTNPALARSIDDDGIEVLLRGSRD